MKKFLKSFVICLVVAVFAICGFAGCGKKEEPIVPQTEPAESFVEYGTYTEAELKAYLDRDDVVKEFIDGYKFSVKGSVLFNVVPFEYVFTGRILLFARGVEGDFACHMMFMDQTEVDVVGYIKDEKIYAKTTIEQNLWAEQDGPFGYNPTDVEESVNMVFGEIEKMLNFNDGDVKDILTVLTEMGTAKQKIHSKKTGNTTYMAMLEIFSFSATFNKYNELISAKMIAADAASGQVPIIVTMDFEALDHSERIQYPDNLDIYKDITNREE